VALWDQGTRNETRYGRSRQSVSLSLIRWARCPMLCEGGARTRHGSRNTMGNQEEGYGARDARWDTSHHSILQELRSG